MRPRSGAEPGGASSAAGGSPVAAAASAGPVHRGLARGGSGPGRAPTAGKGRGGAGLDGHRVAPTWGWLPALVAVLLACGPGAAWAQHQLERRWPPAGAVVTPAWDISPEPGVQVALAGLAPPGAQVWVNGTPATVLSNRPWPVACIWSSWRRAAGSAAAGSRWSAEAGRQPGASSSGGQLGVVVARSWLANGGNRPYL